MYLRILAFALISLFSFSAFAQDDRAKVFASTDARPMAILLPGDGDFVIPPVYVKGVAEPGERMGVFVNGYPHSVVTADARGHFVHRIAWAHSGKLAIEIRRGESRRHRIEVKVAKVTPGVGTRTLTNEKKNLWSAELGADSKRDPVLLDVREDQPQTPVVDSTASPSEPTALRATAPTAPISVSGRHVASIAIGYGLQVLGVLVLASGDTTGGQESWRKFRKWVGVAGAIQATNAFAWHHHLSDGDAGSVVGSIVGSLLPSVIGLYGTLTENPYVTTAGMILQPVGASYGASF